jgi:pyrroloquinoline-quinone synthase
MLTRSDLLLRLNKLGAKQYHHRHPFHKLLRSGKASKLQVQAWALNRYYYQLRIPQKDALIISRSSSTNFRRAWVQRLLEHDGTLDYMGGISEWLTLTSALDLDPDYVKSTKGVLDGCRAAVDSYLDYVRDRSFVEAVSSSLTELFAPQLIKDRSIDLIRHYDFVSSDSLVYFTKRPERAVRDSDFVIDYLESLGLTDELVQIVMRAVEWKCNMLWQFLDALHYAYVESYNGTSESQNYLM